MKAIGFLIVAFFACSMGHGQKLCVELTKTRASDEDTAALSRISSAVGFDPRTIFLYVSHDPAVRDRGGALSLSCPIGNGYERWIVYDPALIKSDAARDFVFAHETAHHVNFQSLSGLPWSKDDELQADFDGSIYLLRLGWNKARLVHALDLLNLPQGSESGYPALEERRAKVEQAADFDMRPPAPTNVRGTVAAIDAPSYETSLKKLLDHTYQGSIRFQSVRTEKYVCAISAPDAKSPSTTNFALFDNCALDSRGLFELEMGRDGSLSYWIKQRPDPCPDYAWLCLFAWEPGESQLTFWNQDFGSYGHPGERQLFILEATDPSKGQFLIKIRSGGYVVVDSNTATLHGGGGHKQAAEFRVQFE